jgi:hypothetical protein
MPSEINALAAQQAQRKSSPHLPEPLAVRPKIAWQMLGCGHSHGYALLERDELDSYTDGVARWVTTDSIRRYIARRLAKAGKIRKSRRKTTTNC